MNDTPYSILVVENDPQSEDGDLARRCMSLGARECVVKSWNFTEVLPILLQTLADR